MQKTSLFTINEETCTLCEQCIKVCPRNIVHRETTSNLPVVNEELSIFCAHCGQCAVICPSGSFQHSTCSIDDLMDINRELLPDGEQLNELLRSRRSIRNYKGKPVPRDFLEKILDTVRYAPTGQNSRAVEWLVIDDQNALQLLKDQTTGGLKKFVQTDSPLVPLYKRALIEIEKGKDLILRGAPQVIFAKAPHTAVTGAQDVIIALTHFELAAITNGLGTCWAGGIINAIKDNESVIKELGLQDSYYYAMMVGYPDVTFHKVPVRNQAKISFL